MTEAEWSAEDEPAPKKKKRVEDADLIDKLWAMAFLYDRAGRHKTSHWPTRWHILDYKRHWPTGKWRARWKIAYPRPYYDLVKKNAKKHGYPGALQMGIIGSLQAAAHNIAISIASVCYMLPLGLSFVLTARVGRVYGREQLASLRLRVASGLMLTLMMTTLTMLLLIALRSSLAGLYSDDTELTELAAGLLILAALFQLSDGAQVALIGLLRGLQDLRVPMLINAVSYWGIAFPLGYFAAHHTALGAYGLWMGLIIGLTVASVLLAFRLRNRLQHVQKNWPHHV